MTGFSAVLRIRDGTTLEVYAEGSNLTQSAAVIAVVSKAFSDVQ